MPCREEPLESLLRPETLQLFFPSIMEWKNRRMKKNTDFSLTYKENPIFLPTRGPNASVAGLQFRVGNPSSSRKIARKIGLIFTTYTRGCPVWLILYFFFTYMGGVPQKLCVFSTDTRGCLVWLILYFFFTYMGGCPRNYVFFFQQIPGGAQYGWYDFWIGCVVVRIHNNLLDMNLYKLCGERSAQVCSLLLFGNNWQNPNTLMPKPIDKGVWPLSEPVTA